MGAPGTGRSAARPAGGPDNGVRSAACHGAGYLDRSGAVTVSAIDLCVPTPMRAV